MNRLVSCGFVAVPSRVSPERVQGRSQMLEPVEMGSNLGVNAVLREMPRVLYVAHACLSIPTGIIIFKTQLCDELVLACVPKRFAVFTIVSY